MAFFRGTPVISWAALLKDSGVNVIVTDAFEGFGYTPQITYTNVEKKDSLEAVVIYKNKCNVLMTVWPAFGRSYTAEALEKFTGDKLVYIGESRGGCTACDYFFNLLERNWDLIKEIEIPTWFLVNDTCQLYQRKS